MVTQSVENPGVAFVKGANERKVLRRNKQTVMYDGLTILGTN